METLKDKRIQIGIVVILVMVISAYALWPSPTPDPDIPVEDKFRVLRSTWAFPTYIDPAIGTDGSSTSAQINLYDSLVKLGKGGTIIPWLASDWTFSSDGSKCTFNIMQGVKFHDGTELTAADVAFSFNRLLTMGTGDAYVIEPYVYPNVTAIDDYTVQFNMKNPFGPFVSTMSFFYVLNEDLIEQNLGSGEYGDWGDYGTEWLTTNDAGSGPYKVKYFVLEEKLVMEKFEDYWAGFADKAPDIVEMIGTTEAITVRTMLANEELEYSDQWQSVESLTVIQEISGVEISGLTTTVGGAYLTINTQKPPTDDIHFRMAMAYALDYDKVVTELFPGTVQMKGPVNSAMLGHDPDIFQFQQDLDKAREELALSKYADNYTQYEVELHWCAEVPDEEKVAMQFMVDCDQIGIDIKVIKTPWTAMVQEAGSLESSPHIMWVFVTAAYPEAGAHLMPRYHSANAASWKQNEWLLNETLDAMIEDALMTLDTDERIAKYQAIQREVMRICPSIFLFQQISWRAYPDYVTIPWVEDGTYMQAAIFGDVFEYTPQRAGHFECRLFEVDREIEYGN